MTPPPAHDPDDAIAAEAITFVVRLMSGEATTDDAAAIRLWRATSPTHENAFLDAVRVWRGLQDAARTSPGRASADEPSASRHPAPQKSGRGRFA